MIGDELVHVIKNLVQQEMREIRPFVYAHVSNYDPTHHAVRVVVPSLRDELTDEPVVSGWLPLGSLQVGDGYGIQVAPAGGASVTNPTGGEQCLVALNERTHGVAAIISMFYTGAQLAPGPALSPPLQAGEMVMVSNGSIIRWHKDKSLEITCYGTLNVNVHDDVNINSATGKISVGAQTGDISVVAVGTVNVQGKQVNIGGAGGPAVARVGDTVTVGTATGVISSGSKVVFST